MVFVTQESFASGCPFSGMPVGGKSEPLQEAEVCNAISREDKMIFSQEGSEMGGINCVGQWFVIRCCDERLG